MKANTSSFPNYPQVSNKNFLNWNEEMFVKYNNERIYRHPNRIIRYIERKRVEFLIQNLAPKKTDLILAAGCGEGFIENQITTYKKFYLIDASTTAIKKAKEKLTNKKNVQYYKGNLEKLPFTDNKFDKIECSEVIEHVLNPDKMLSEFRRVLKKNGLLVISFPNEPLINFLKQILIKLGIFNLFFPNIPINMLEEWHLRAMDFNRFKELIGKQWKVNNVSGAPLLQLPIRYVISCSPVK